MSFPFYADLPRFFPGLAFFDLEALYDSSHDVFSLYFDDNEDDEKVVRASMRYKGKECFSTNDASADPIFRYSEGLHKVQLKFFMNCGENATYTTYFTLSLAQTRMGYVNLEESFRENREFNFSGEVGFDMPNHLIDAITKQRARPEAERRHTIKLTGASNRVYPGRILPLHKPTAIRLGRLTRLAGMNTYILRSVHLLGIDWWLGGTKRERRNAHINVFDLSPYILPDGRNAADVPLAGASPYDYGQHYAYIKYYQDMLGTNVGSSFYEFWHARSRSIYRMSVEELARYNFITHDRRPI